MSGIVGLTVCSLVSPVVGSGQTSTTESRVVPSLLVSSAGECVAVSSLPTVAPAKALTVSNLVMPHLASFDVVEAMFEPPVVRSMSFSRLSDSAVTKFITWCGLVVPALAKFSAVPAVIESVAFLDLDTIGKWIARPVLVSRRGSSVLRISPDGFGVGVLIANSGLLIATVPRFLALSSFVLTIDKSVAEAAF